MRLSETTTTLTLVGLLAAGAAAQPVFEFGPGQTLNAGSVLPDGATINISGGTIDAGNGELTLPNAATVNISSGVIDTGVDLANGVLNVTGGQVSLPGFGTGGPASGFTNDNNTIHISGGVVGEFFQVFDSDLTLSGGSIGSFGLFGEATATITGGEVRRFPDVFGAGVVNIFGGDIFSIRAFADSTINLHGSGFALDGVPIGGLSLGQQVEVTQRNVTLSATLADGSLLETDLDTSFGDFFGDNPDGVSADALITITLTPIQGDYNADGVVDAADYTVWRDALGQPVDTPFAGADGDGDQQVTPADYQVFLDNFGAVAPGAVAVAVAVPEPGTLFLVALILAPSARRPTLRTR